MALPLYVPLAYIVLLVAGLSAFSRFYRQRAAGRLAADATTQPWFPQGHEQRDIYQSLIGYDEASKSSDEPRISESFLRAALLNRAMEDVRRLRRMREDKQALAVLLQRGSLGDVTAERFALAEKELEAEILDTVNEANSFHPEWGKVIFNQAGEMVNHIKVKETYFGIPAQREEIAHQLKGMGKPIPEPTVELPPLHTPPGTKVSMPTPPPGMSPGGPAGSVPPGAAGPGGPGGSANQIKIPPQVAAAMQVTGGKITPQMLPAIAAANGGQLPAPLMAMVMQARAAQMQQQQGQAAGGAQAATQKPVAGPAPPPQVTAAGQGKKAATVEETDDE